MARKRRTSEAAAPAVTVERAARLCRLVSLTARGGLGRARLLQLLKVDLRGFYRDLQLLRGAGVDISPADGRYVLSGAVQEAIDRLPCPDPHLTLGELALLTTGRGIVSRKLRQLLADIVGK
jgi:hypothetical protein